MVLTRIGDHNRSLGQSPFIGVNGLDALAVVLSPGADG